MSGGPHDIVSSADGSAVRYKVYSEKNRKAKIKLCVRFDPDDPKPEREWDQFRDDGDPEAAVRVAARRLLGGSAPTQSVEAARAASERVAAERQAAADKETQELQQWHAEKAVREAEEQAVRDAAAAERAARWQQQQSARRERLEARREEEAHAICAAYHEGLACGNEEVRKTLRVVDAYRETLRHATDMLQEERERGRRQAEQMEALVQHALATVRKAKGKRKARLPSASAMLLCSQRSPALRAYFEQQGATAEPTAAVAKEAARAARRQEMREARELGESLAAASEAAEKTAAQEAQQEEQKAFETECKATRTAQQVEFDEHGGFQGWFEHGLSADARDALRERARAFKLLREAEGEQEDGAASDAVADMSDV